MRRTPSRGSRMPSSRGEVAGDGRAGRVAALNFAVWIVSTTVVGAADGVTDCGLKLAVAPGGKPLAENVTGLLNAPWGAIVNSNTALWPGKTVAALVGPPSNTKSSTDCVSGAAMLPVKPLLPL